MQAKSFTYGSLALFLAMLVSVAGCAGVNGVFWDGPDGHDGKEVFGKALAAGLKNSGIEAEAKFGADQNIAVLTTPGDGSPLFAIENGEYEYVVIKGDDIVAYKKATTTSGCRLRITNLPSGREYRCVGTCPTGTGCFMGGKSTPDGYYVFCKCK